MGGRRSGRWQLQSVTCSCWSAFSGVSPVLLHSWSLQLCIRWILEAEPTGWSELSTCPQTGGADRFALLVTGESGPWFELSLGQVTTGVVFNPMVGMGTVRKVAEPSGGESNPEELKYGLTQGMLLLSNGLGTPTFWQPDDNSVKLALTIRPNTAWLNSVRPRRKRRDRSQVRFILAKRAAEVLPLENTIRRTVGYCSSRPEDNSKM